MTTETAPDPLELSAQTFEKGATAPRDLVIIHGLFGSGRNWARVAKALSNERVVHTLDLRNHGKSPWADGMCYDMMAADIQRFIEENCQGRADVLGHSLGGKVAMALALMAPDMVQRLIVVDIAPVAYKVRLMKLVKAMQNINLAYVSGRNEVEEKLAETVTDKTTRSFLMHNLERCESGTMRWMINLDAIENNMSNLSDWPFEGQDVSYDGPSLFLTGALSQFVQPEHHEAIKHFFPQSQRLELKDTGHWLHAEKPEETIQIIRDFLAK